MPLETQTQHNGANLFICLQEFGTDWAKWRCKTNALITEKKTWTLCKSKSTGAKFTEPSKNFKMKYMMNHACNMPLETQTQHNAAD